jgi:hypothetical protein
LKQKKTSFIFSPYAGDMLELTAVDVPELHDLSDVIVFSTEGDRKLILLYSIESMNF